MDIRGKKSSLEELLGIGTVMESPALEEFKIRVDVAPGDVGQGWGSSWPGCS